MLLIFAHIYCRKPIISDILVTISQNVTICIQIVLYHLKDGLIAWRVWPIGRIDARWISSPAIDLSVLMPDLKSQQTLTSHTPTEALQHCSAKINTKSWCICTKHYICMENTINLLWKQDSLSWTLASNPLTQVLRLSKSGCE